jgi:integrase
LAEHTVHDYSTCLKAHTLDAWGNRSIDEISTQNIRELIEEKVGHRSPSHQKNMLKFIRGVFNYGVEMGSLQRNPVPKMRFRIGEKIKKVLIEEQVRLLLTRAKELNIEWYPHWAMAVYTGMRNGELYALTWEKVNLDDRIIKVDCSWNNKDQFKSTKSGDGRIIEIAPNLVALLKQLKLQNSDSPFVLPRIDRWDRGEQARELNLFLRGINLPPVRFHDLRATWATLLLSKGVEPIRVMKMGGWKDLKTLMIYVRMAGVDIRGMTDCLDLHNPYVDVGQVLRFERP